MDKENLKDELIKYSTTFTNSSITCEGITLPLTKYIIDNFDDTPTTEQAWKKIAKKYDKSIANVEADFEDWINSGRPQTEEKPEIPKFVADWIEEVKQRGWGLADALNCFVSPIMPEKVKQWIQFDFAAIGCHHDNQELLAKAWLHGYTIEKESVWVVKTFAGYLTDLERSVNDWQARVSSSKYDEDIIAFKCKEKANEIAELIGGVVGEWSE
ncbi:DUF1642 domain-containing protein [Tetragenococcus halophilus]|uniref:DUF1642 domain-containing protein n=1 Tax=Tetragenococcus halophilus TaxID=51669 RepID=A0A3G5FKD5_TETHA|nr:DUF1642 domain-containing protein [Tetragenococcus halophilus]AYW50817.1 DUF1642 domain-containing protein [Tetragenococcus halophilus]GBD64901.1 hypothetical protein TEHD23766T_2328 [Tetragenococcus halophilus subsp. flandriensis]GMA08909.1 hypothetical protein GCM10025886_20600 [Tetragenococcus halophilus subsp. flandriensis]